MKNLRVRQHSNTARTHKHTAFLFLSEGQTSARNALDGILDKEISTAVISGPLGSGKTTLLKRFIRCLGNEVSTAKVTGSKYSTKNILPSVLKAFKQDIPDSGTKNTLKTLVNFLQEQKFAQKTALLIVDDADLLSLESLESLLSLLEFGPDKESLVKLVLTGGTNPLSSLYEAEPPASTLEKILSAQILPFSEEETDNYLKRLHQNPGNQESVFSKSSSRLIHQYCKGNPLAIKQLSRWALRFAYQNNQTSVTLSFVKMALNTSAWVRFSEQFPSVHGSKPSSSHRARIGQHPKVALFQENRQISEHDLGEEPVSLGRSTDNTIVLGDPIISRQHARLSRVNNQIWIKNLSHSKSVYVNMQPIQHQALNDGDIIRIDDFLLFFTLENTALTCSQESTSLDSSKPPKPDKLEPKNSIPSPHAIGANEKPNATVLSKGGQHQSNIQKPHKHRVIIATGGFLLLLGMLSSLIFMAQNKNTQTPNPPVLSESSIPSASSELTKPTIASEKHTETSAIPQIKSKAADPKTANYTVDTFYDGTLFRTEIMNLDNALDPLGDMKTNK
jgi:type II secretory pathway predicted ATPase ExeA/pSer/pThr/pTyr-binding forkhead associated (FHA) protein